MRHAAVMKHFLPLALLMVSCSPKAENERHRLDEARQDRRCADRLDRFQPANGVISTRAIAKKVAYQYLREVYPDDDGLHQLTATLKNGIWHVEGYIPPDHAGGVAEIDLCQSNGRVLRIIHGQ